eukprot:488189-Hanusia_phi.AAC.1
MAAPVRTNLRVDIRPVFRILPNSQSLQPGRPSKQGRAVLAVRVKDYHPLVVVRHVLAKRRPLPPVHPPRAPRDPHQVLRIACLVPRPPAALLRTRAGKLQLGGSWWGQGRLHASAVHLHVADLPADGVDEPEPAAAVLPATALQLEACHPS